MIDRAEGTIIAGRFRLTKPLSQGAMGDVWLAVHLGLEIPCAVKFMKAELFDVPDLRKRFEREAKVAAQIRCPNVVQMLDFGIWEDVPYIAMELLDGEDLASRLSRRGRLAPSETIAILAQVARALSKAHEVGLVHRDLKPENIFITTDGDRELVKVLDFGIVRVNGPRPDVRSTCRGELVGTPTHMSPEQARGQLDIDSRSDLWSLAVVAYECLSGELPFNGETVMEMALRIIGGPIPLLPSAAGLPPAVDVWWARAAARDRDARFPSANALVEALAEALALPRTSRMPKGFFSTRPGSDPGTPAPLRELAASLASAEAPSPDSMPDGGLARTEVGVALLLPARRPPLRALAAGAGALAFAAVLLVALRTSPPLLVAHSSGSAEVWELEATAQVAAVAPPEPEALALEVAPTPSALPPAKPVAPPPPKAKPARTTRPAPPAQKHYSSFLPRVGEAPRKR